MERKIITINAEGVRLGKLATDISQQLMGKNSPNFENHLDNGAKVIVYNTDKLSIHPNKLTKRKYFWYTGYPGGIREILTDKLMQKDSRRVLYKAVYGMLPKNRLRAKMLRRLEIYKGEIN
jgi:large subunit ribosomal protein L13